MIAKGLSYKVCHGIIFLFESKFLVWTKKGPHIKRDKLGGGLHGGPYKLRDQK